MSAMKRDIQPPVPLEDSGEFWNGTRRGELMLKFCDACQRAHHYPRAHCPYCFSNRTSWRKASGHATIYSWTVFRRAPVPYAIAYVELEEGLRLITNIVEADLDRLAIGQAVEVTFEPTRDGPPIAVFRPAGAAGDGK